MGLDVMIFIFWMLSFKPTFSLSSFIFINRLFSSFSLYFVPPLRSSNRFLLVASLPPFQPILHFIAVCNHHHKSVLEHVHHPKTGFPDSSVGKEPSCNVGDPCSIPGSGRSAGKGIGYPLQYSWASLVAQLGKNSPAMRETWLWSLDWEDPLEKGKATHSSILAWRIPWTIVHGVTKCQTWLRDFHTSPQNDPSCWFTLNPYFCLIFIPTPSNYGSSFHLYSLAFFEHFKFHIANRIMKYMVSCVWVFYRAY